MLAMVARDPSEGGPSWKIQRLHLQPAAILALAPAQAALAATSLAKPAATATARTDRPC